MLLNDQQIKEYALAGMIDPFIDHQVREYQTRKVISYGLSSAGYDIRCAPEFKVFRPVYDGASIIDPKNFNVELLADHTGDYCIIPPNSYILTRSIEHFSMPATITGTVLGKSSYARAGIIVNMSPLEAGWRGYLTIEISNAAPLPAKIYANEGIAQVLFFQIEQPEVTYASRDGKYQDQAAEIVTTRL